MPCAGRPCSLGGATVILHSTAIHHDFIMRNVFLFLLILNAVIFALGQGWLGAAPAEQGRDPARLQQQINAQAVEVGQAQTR